MWFLAAVPGQCEKPTVSNITMDSMTVSWEEPEDDGGTPITGYWLERKETTSKRWARVTRDPLRPMPLGESYNVTGLIEGSQYVFRVTAINAAGPGLPSPSTELIFARDPICKHRNQLLNTVLLKLSCAMLDGLKLSML